MDIYHRHRLVSRIAYHVAHGKTWEEICALNLQRRDPSPQSEMDACKDVAYQSVRNADLLQEELDRRAAATKEAREAGSPGPTFPPLRLCDLPGCRFPAR